MRLNLPSPGEIRVNYRLIEIEREIKICSTVYSRN